MGGLGNWLFQVAAAVKFAEDLGVQYCLVKEKVRTSPHSSTDYFSTIFSKFNRRDRLRSKGVIQIFEPANFNHPDYRAAISPFSGRDIDVYLVGYFQHYDFISRMFKDMLTLPVVDCSKVRDTCFLHIRGGDYVNHPIHDVKLADYYMKSIAHMKSLGITKFSVFTNDRTYALQQGFLNDIDYEFVDANELESLVLMSECRAGICANSSFSWWGAYLNRDRPICMPSKWFNSDINTSGYYFPGVAVITV
jgi:hypothetical protein